MSIGSNEQQVLARQDIVSAYRVAEFATLARDGSPVCWPLAPSFEHERIVFSTGYLYPTKARNARRNPKVAALFSDPTASGRSDDDPLVLVQGLAEVFDQDLQRNTERYIDQIMAKALPMHRLLFRLPGMLQFMVGYLTRIFMEVIPEREYVWARGTAPPETLCRANRPASFSPKAGIALPEDIFKRLPYYNRPPVLAYIDAAGYPAMIRVQATLQRDRVVIDHAIEASEGAPACLTYHRLIGNYQANDAFIIRGHFDAAGNLIPEKLVSGVTFPSPLKTLRTWREWGRQLPQQLAKDGRPMIVARPSGRS